MDLLLSFLRPSRIILALGFLLTSTLFAQTTWRVTGTVGVVGANLGTSIAFGDPFQADFVFDENQTPWNNSGTIALYYLQSSTLSIDTSGSGTLTWTKSTPAGNDINHGFSIENSTGRDALVISGYPTGPSLNGNAVIGISFTFIDTTKVAFSSVSIPFSLTSGMFNSKLLDLGFGTNTYGTDIIRFNATSFEINPGSAVPEPSTYAAWAGLAVLGLAAWRRRLDHEPA